MLTTRGKKCMYMGGVGTHPWMRRYMCTSYTCGCTEVVPKLGDFSIYISVRSGVFGGQFQFGSVQKPRKHTFGSVRFGPVGECLLTMWVRSSSPKARRILQIRYGSVWVFGGLFWFGLVLKPTKCTVRFDPAQVST